MIFNSFDFLWMFPVIFLLYYLIAGNSWINSKIPRIGNFFLLFCSYALYIKVEPVYALILLAVTAITYCAGRLFASNGQGKRRRILCFCLVTLALVPLLVFKYYNFVSSQLGILLGWSGVEIGLKGFNYVVPLGLSFYTFQAIGYVFDVYYKRINPEYNWWDYMLFVAFFPQIASGPISKAKYLLPQIKEKRTFSEVQATEGLRLLLWGMFMKTVLADRLGLYVDAVFDNYQYQNGLSLALGGILYSFQIYGDFAGYSFMAVGVGKLMGFDLINNFRRPYFSVSISDFWRRWHISLSIWLRDYVYIPLGGSRCSKLRNYLNILITFLVSGIWHGANWSFIVWGLIHGIVQVFEKMLNLSKSGKSKGGNAIRVAVTFCIVTLAWIIFRMPSLSDGVQLISRMFTSQPLPVYYPSLSACVFMSSAMIVVVFKDSIEEYFNVSDCLALVKSTVLRWSCYVVILAMILLFGVLDSSTFIYVNF